MRFRLFLFITLNLITSQIYAEWIKYAPIRTVTNMKCDRLNDIASHTRDMWTTDGEVTIAHESTHGLHADIRKKFGPGYNCYYFYNDLGYVVKEPKGLTLRQIVSKIPKEYRGRIFDLYLVNSQQWWNEQPSYILDELTAYTNGTIVGIELNTMDRAEYSLTNAFELNIYALYLRSLANQEDISECVDFMTARNILVYDKIENIKDVRLTEKHDLLLKVIENEKR